MPCRQLVARPGQVAGPARGSTAQLTPTAVGDKLGPSGTASIERRVDIPVTSLVFRRGTEPIGKPLRRREFRESEDNMKGAGAAIFHHCNLQELHWVKQDFESLTSFVSSLIGIRESLLSSERQLQTSEKLLDR
ncbi:hypothetical protein GW17_00052045 [Ensete ventricosum]|nr:hypothetical protein GW17_00052045 [Ensete ventricosum]